MERIDSTMVSTTTRKCAGLFSLVFLPALLLCASAAFSTPLIVPFDFSRSEIALDVRANGVPLYMMLDTGVDPSSIDLARAEALHFKIDRTAAGEASGVGGATHAQVFPATIEGLAIGGRAFAPVAALAGDLGALSARYGRRLDGVLGYSFLHDKIALIDYPAHELRLFDRADDAAPLARSCKVRSSTPMRLLKDEYFPLISDFRFGPSAAAATLDTGSSGSITLYRDAFNLPGVRAALVPAGKTSASGFRGSATITKYTIRMPVGFGPFMLPPGAAVTFREAPGAGVAANIGNRLFATMKLKMLLDYRSRTLSFFGGCV